MTKTNFTKRLFALVLAVVMVAALLPAATLAATTYTDVKEKDWFYTPVTEWSTGTNAILEGYGNGLFGPNDPIKSVDLEIIMQRILGQTTRAWGDSATLTREEAAKVICEALNIEPVTNPTSSQKFADDNSIGATYKEFVYGLKARGYVQGQGSNQFAPKSKFTRAEVLQIVYNSISGFADSNISGATYSQDLVVRKGATLSNVTVRGDLIIGQGVANSSVMLDNVSVTGRIIVLGGSTVDLSRTTSNGVLAGKTSEVTIKVSSGTIGSLTTLAGSSTSIEGSVTTLNVAGVNSVVNIGTRSNSSVSNLNVTGRATVTVGSYGTISNGTISTSSVSLLGTTGTVTGTITVTGTATSGVVISTPNTTVKVMANAGTVKDRSGGTIATAGQTGTTDKNGYASGDGESSSGGSSGSSSGSVTLNYLADESNGSKSSGSLPSLNPKNYYPKSTYQKYWDGEGNTSSNCDTFSSSEIKETFYDNDYDFYGWASSSTNAQKGIVAYDSGTSVSKVSESTVYAVWGPEGCEDMVEYEDEDGDGELTLYYRGRTSSTTSASEKEYSYKSYTNSTRLSSQTPAPKEYYPMRETSSQSVDYWNGTGTSSTQHTSSNTDTFSSTEYAKTFYSNDYEFYGWATSETDAERGNASFEYNDYVEEVIDAGYDELYAVWGPSGKTNKVYWKTVTSLTEITDYNSTAFTAKTLSGDQNKTTISALQTWAALPAQVNLTCDTTGNVCANLTWTVSEVGNIVYTTSASSQNTAADAYANAAAAGATTVIFSGAWTMPSGYKDVATPKVPSPITVIVNVTAAQTDVPAVTELPTAITNDYTVTANTVVAFGKSSTLAVYKKLTVNPGVTLDVAGTLDIAGTLVIDGKITVNGSGSVTKNVSGGAMISSTAVVDVSGATATTFFGNDLTQGLDAALSGLTVSTGAELIINASQFGAGANGLTAFGIDGQSGNITIKIRGNTNGKYEYSVERGSVTKYWYDGAVHNTAKV
ncbi:MAG: S-layer homology domain-containing protein [Oscillospiraceae bacterium]|nr:S-layer homology domain-containing protein [Oscillospiraceae bacterium]